MKRKPKFTPRYSWIECQLASPTEPMPPEKRRHQLSRMWGGLAAIESGDNPNRDDWRLCSDAVNLLDTLIDAGHAEDAQGLLPDAVEALAEAALRHRPGQVPIWLDATGVQLVRAVLEDYAELLAVISHRTMLETQNATDRRIWDIQQGRMLARDVMVVAI